MRPIARARKLLRGHWQEAICAQCLEVLIVLALLLLSWHFGRVIRETTGEFAQPFLILATLAFCFFDLLLRSPIRAGKAAFYAELMRDRSLAARRILSGFQADMYQKAVSLRMALWMRRIGLYILWFSPSAVLLALSDTFRQSGLNTSTAQLAFLLLTFFAVCALVAAVVIVELRLLRFMPAWYLLEECSTAREAMRRARRQMKGQLGDALRLYVDFLGWRIGYAVIVPYFYASPLFAVARAAWVNKAAARFSKEG